jgi:GNAT superfamily N-acetyltransferase
MLAMHCHGAFWLSPTFRFLIPTMGSYPSEFTRIWRAYMYRRYIALDTLFLVACLACDPSIPIAHGIFCREGVDAGAKDFVRSKGLWSRMWLYILGLYFCAYDRLAKAIWVHDIWDIEATWLNSLCGKVDDAKFWSQQERKNRWYVVSLVTDSEHQRKGAGKLLMREVIERAQRERVVVGMEATPMGAKLYRSLGFEKLGDPYLKIEGEKGGGIMILYPEGWEGSRGGM